MSPPDPQQDILAQITPILDVVHRWLIAYAILLARPLAMLSIHPIFTQLELSNVLKSVVATGFILPMWQTTASGLSASDPGLLSLVLLAIKESLIGIALGIPLSLPFWVLLAAGDIVDQQRGASQGRLNDPAGFGDMSVTGMLFLLCGIAVLTGSGRLNMIPETLYRSWQVWRPLEMAPSLVQDWRTADLVLHLLDTLQAQAVTLAAPIILAMLLSDVAIMLTTRIASQLRVDDLALAVRNLVFVVFMPLYAGFLLLYATNVESLLTRSFQILRLVLHPTDSGVSVP